ncbi:MAG TPA: T9SS type A sorting domain-containing protein, partial [Saprospiraceae bacterium]|nr:T9SS type A sorting domain-containing protein [Saprospiraceae bacterium]
GNHLFPIQWQLVDMCGTIMKNGNSFENNFMIEVREIPAGMYFIQLTSGENEKWSRKIVVN